MDSSSTATIERAVRTVAELMEVAAITAPKAVGRNYIVTRTLYGHDVQALSEDMERYGLESGRKNYDRDGANVSHSDAVVLIGLKDATPPGINCGACGSPTCIAINTTSDVETEFIGPQCPVRVLDMGIALGSAVKTAQIHNVDNRIIYRIGVCARRLGQIDADFVMGVPLSISGKSIYFDR